MEFSANTIEKISRILAEEITGSKITNMLQNLYLEDSPKTIFGLASKWERLYYAIVVSQNNTHSGDALLQIIEYIMDPVNFIGSAPGKFRNAIAELNAVLSLNGLEVNDSGKIRPTKKSTTFSQAYEKAANLKKDLQAFHIHPQVLAFCRPEILQENYFHLVFEASKCLFVELQALSRLTIDGNKLVNECFDGKNPLIVMNKLTNNNDWEEHRGLQSLLNTIVYLYRNPKAHNPKIFSEDSKEDAITALLIISKARYLLESCFLNVTRCSKT